MILRLTACSACGNATNMRIAPGLIYLIETPGLRPRAVLNSTSQTPRFNSRSCPPMTTCAAYTRPGGRPRAPWREWLYFNLLVRAGVLRRRRICAPALARCVRTAAAWIEVASPIGDTPSRSGVCFELQRACMDNKQLTALAVLTRTTSIAFKNIRAHYTTRAMICVAA